MLFMAVATTAATAQTPVANRIRAVVKHLPKSSVVAAKYTDNERHSIYYIVNHRLFCYDVVTDKDAEVAFPENYLKIDNCYVVGKEGLLFVVIDRGSLSKNYAKDGKRLYMITPLTKDIKEVGSGFNVRTTTLKGEECFCIKKAYRLLNPSEVTGQQQWLAREHFYGIDGSVIYAGKEFKIRIAKK